jgi:hypothetical protein
MAETAKISELLKEKLEKQAAEETKLDFFDKIVLKLLEYSNRGKFGLKEKIFFLKELAYLLK